MADLVVKHFRPSLEVGHLDEAEVLRMVTDITRTDAMTAVGVAMFKRRLSDASDAELAADKKVARIIGNALNNVDPIHWVDLRELARWDPEVRRRAAVVVWREWLPEVDTRLDDLMALTATWVMKQNLSSMDVRRALRRLMQARKVTSHGG